MKNLSQDSRVLAWLKTHGSITQAQANYRMKPGISRLSAIIKRLEDNKGIKIKHEDELLKVDGKAIATITRYSL